MLVVAVKPAKIVSLPVEAPVHVRDVSPARNPVACTIHIQFLTRPFTIGQLKELLSKHGPLSDIEGGFWMDKVKSHCYATVSLLIFQIIQILIVLFNRFLLFYSTFMIISDSSFSFKTPKAQKLLGKSYTVLNGLHLTLRS